MDDNKNLRNFQRELDFVQVAKTRELDEMTMRLKELPQGKLLLSSEHGYLRYRWRRSKSDRRKLYLSQRTSSTLIKELAERRYLEELVKVEKANLQLLEGIEADLQKWIPGEQVYASLPEGIRAVTEPREETTEAYVSEWLSYRNRTDYYDEARQFKTANGDWVRSKSEVIIANTLYEMGLPYKYEEEIYLNRSRFLPDFTILDTRNRKEVYYEHFGLMGDEDYATSACKKIAEYSRAGYQLGDGFLCSMETAHAPLQPDQVRRLLESRFPENKE